MRAGHTAGLANTSGPMGEVVPSLAGAPDGDMRAMAIPGGHIAAVQEAALPSGTASALFCAACAACHTQGLTNSLTAAQVPLAQSMVLHAPAADALKTVICDGIMAPLNLPLRDIPAFGAELSDEQISDLAQYLRARFAPDLLVWPTVQ